MNINVTQNDKGIKISTSFVINKTPYNLTDKSIRLIIVTPDNKKLYRECNIVNANEGQAEYILTEEDTAKAGLHKMYFIVYDDNSRITAQNMITYYVLSEFGGV